jgi:hypothetical protein
VGHFFPNGPYGDIEVFTIAPLVVNNANNATTPEPLSLLVWAGLASVAGLVRSRRGADQPIASVRG